MPGDALHRSFDGATDADMSLDYRPGLDGLRGVAVVLVLVFHSDLGWLPGGFLGVSVFFTLSGFLITSLLIREIDTTGRLDLLSFWERRFRRLLPAALATIAAVSVAGVWLGSSVEQSRLRGDAIASVFYVSNWRSIVSELSYEEIFSTKSPLIHLWSLAIEEQMYIVVPLVAMLVVGLGFGRRAIGFVALVLVGVSALVATLWLDGDRIYYGTDARAAELLIGVGAAAFIGPKVWGRGPRSSRAVSWMSIVSLTAIVGLARFSSTDSDWVYGGGLAPFALLSLMCVLGALVPGPMRTVLATAPLVRVGKVSYGLYLFHWPIFTWIDEERLGFGGVALFAVRLGATVAVTFLSYVALETPIRERRILQTRRTFAISMLGATAVTLAVPILFLRTVSSAPDTEVRTLSTAPTTSPTDGTGGTLDTWTRDDIVTRSRSLRILVIGDSTAENVARALAQTESVGVVSAGVLGCPLVRVVEVFDRPRASQETSYCPDNVEIVRSSAPDIDVLFVVGGVSNQWSYRALDGSVVDPGTVAYQNDFDALMESLQEVLAPWAVPVVVLDNPRTRSDDGVLGDEIDVHASWRSQIERWDDEWETVTRLNIDDALAPADSSLGREQRPDGVHLEESFAADLARTVVLPALEASYVELMDRLGSIECLVKDPEGIRFALASCRSTR